MFGGFAAKHYKKANSNPMEASLERKRAVITGLGVISCIGLNVETFWNNLINGQSGIKRISRFDPSQLPCQIAGEIPEFDPLLYLDRKTARRITRATQMSVASTREALEDAKLPYPIADGERVGVLFGTALGGLDRLSEADHIFQEKGYRGLTPHHFPSGIPNMPSFQIAQEFQCLGPNNTNTTACAASTQAVGEAAELIRRGAADVVITGGVDSLVIDLAIAAFCAMRALPVNYNDDPQRASRPFDLKREGFLLSEGSATLILESLEHAQARGARIYGEIAGHASSSDGYDMIALHPEAQGPIRAMRWALNDAGIEPEQVDYINAHGTSTPMNDRIETLAIKKLFGEDAYQMPISSTKSMLGHAMGASGGLEALACTLAIRDKMIPPTINYETPDPECDLNYVPNQAISHEINYALSNSFGLGGQNACLVIKRFEA
jgi:3-oxoacyl-[acyl-carrier-protein] synthase II